MKYWNVIRDGRNVWAVHEPLPGYIYDPLVSCLVNNPGELDRMCHCIADKRWGSKAIANEFREIVVAEKKHDN